MVAKIIVFENEDERATCSVSTNHNWKNQPNLFGNDISSLLEHCENLVKLCYFNTYNLDNIPYNDREKLKNFHLGNIYNIAKKYGYYISWCGNSFITYQPEKFLIFEAHKEIGFIIF